MLKIAIIGEQCAGKTETCEAIQRIVGRSTVVKFADPIYHALCALGVGKGPGFRGYAQESSDVAKKYFGDDVYVRAFERSVNAIVKLDSSKCIVCDDVRYPAELELVKELGFFVIYVGAQEQVRRERAKAQGLEFKEDHSSERHVRALKANADQVIDNSVDNRKLLENRIKTILQCKLQMAA